MIVLNSRKQNPTKNLGKLCKDKGFVATHVLVNQERARRGKSPLHRSVTLDRTARDMAEKVVAGDWSDVMAMQVTLHQHNVQQITQRGTNILAIHREIMKDERLRSWRSGKGDGYDEGGPLVLSTRHKEFGLATARLSDADEIVMVQLFRGEK